METGQRTGLLSPLQPTHRHSAGMQWRSLRLFCVYRLLAITLLFVLHFTDTGLERVGLQDSERFLWALNAYLLAGGGLMLLSALPRWVPFNWQVYLHAGADIVMITWVTQAGGGVESGLGTLAIPAVAGLSLLLQGRTALLLAALTFLALLLSELVRALVHEFGDGAFTQTGLLGAGLLATALLALTLAKRARESEALAKRHSTDLANMTRLNAHIIDSMQAGVIAVNQQGYPCLINAAAWNLLGLHPRPVESLKPLSADLHRAFHAWKTAPDGLGSVQLDGNDQSPELRVRFSPWTMEGATGALIFLDDTAEMRRQMQAAKLASVGRLTASIAHEIRNPLGAISHAAQLLAESPALSHNPADQRLLKIIREQSQRMNTVIQDVLCMSRRTPHQHGLMPLSPWLEQFAQEFKTHHGLAALQLKIQVKPADSQVMFDPQQLHQILWNLCQNALAHAARPKPDILIELVGGTHPISQHSVLDVIDNGCGVALGWRQQIFEPFVSHAQHSSGTGLGLYIARELCESNGGRLEYLVRPEGGACFRIQFPLPHSAPPRPLPALNPNPAAARTHGAWE